MKVRCVRGGRGALEIQVTSGETGWTRDGPVPNNQHAEGGEPPNAEAGGRTHTELTMNKRGSDEGRTRTEANHEGRTRTAVTSLAFRLARGGMGRTPYQHTPVSAQDKSITMPPAFSHSGCGRPHTF